MANPAIGYTAAWKAIRVFIAAATGIPLAAIYQAHQNSAEVIGSPASCRIWADNGLAPAGASWQKQRALRLEQWSLRVKTVAVGELYEVEALDTAFGHTAVDEDTLATIRNAILAGVPAGATGASVGADSLTITATTPGMPLAVSVGDEDLLELTRTHATAVQTAAMPAELVVQVEVVSEVPRDDPDGERQAIEFIGDIQGKLAQGDLGPYAALRKSGVYFLRYLMSPVDLTDLDRAVQRSRARVDIVFALDAQDQQEFDRVVSVEAPAGEMVV